MFSTTAGKWRIIHGMLRPLALPLCVVALSACGGVESATSPADSGTSAEASTDANDLDVGFDAADPLEGIWSGNLVGFAFDSGSTKLQLVITRNAGGSYSIAAKLGAADPPPMIDDPDLGYPATVKPALPPVSHFYGEGFDYLAQHITFTSPDLSFDLNVNDLWAKWAELEKPIDLSPELPGQFGCLPYWAPVVNPDGTCAQTDPVSHTPVSRDCAKLTLCRTSPVLECDASKCSPSWTGLKAKATVDVSAGTMSLTFADDIHDGLNGKTAALTRSTS